MPEAKAPLADWRQTTANDPDRQPQARSSPSGAVRAVGVRNARLVDLARLLCTGALALPADGDVAARWHLGPMRRRLPGGSALPKLESCRRRRVEWHDGV